MSTAIIIDGKKTDASGSVIRQYRKMRGLTQDELGARLHLKKSRIYKKDCFQLPESLQGHKLPYFML